MYHLPAQVLLLHQPRDHRSKAAWNYKEQQPPVQICAGRDQFGEYNVTSIRLRHVLLVAD